MGGSCVLGLFRHNILDVFHPRISSILDVGVICMQGLF